MKKNMKVLAMIILIVIGATTVSCKKNNSVSNNSDDLQGKITVLTDKRHEQPLRAAIEDFQKVHKKVSVNLEVDNNSYGKFSESVKNKDKSIDIVTIDDAYVQYYLDKLPGGFLNVSEDIDSYKNKLPKSKMDNLTKENKVYGFPWSTSPKIILYRKDIVSSEGINIDDIKTWSDYIEMGKKIAKDKGKKVLGNVENENSDIYLLLANQLGISYFNKDNKVNFSDKEWIRVVDTVKNLYSQGIICDYNSKEELINSAKNEEIMSLVADPSYVSYFIQNLPNEKGKWGAIQLPAFESGGNRDVSLGGCNLMINSLSSNAKLSKEFIKFVISNDKFDLESMMKYGVLPVFSNIYNLEKFNKFEDYFNCTVWELLGNAEKGCYQINYTPYFFNIRDDVKNSLAQSNLVNKDTKVVLDSLQKYLEKK